MRKLTTDQETDLVWYFGGGLSVDAGHRSNMGPFLDRLEFNLPPSTATSPSADNLETWILGRVALERSIRRRLVLLTRQQVEVLRVIYSPISEDRVWGLVDAFGGKDPGREAAAVALMLEEDDARARREALQASRSARHRGEACEPIGAHDAPGASQTAVLRDLHKRAANSPAKKLEFDGKVKRARGAIEAARVAYIEAIRDVRRLEREESDRRWSQNIVPFRRPDDAA
jgi:hypothetical protein